jgi:undecaprenyl-diphosphatase
MYLESVVLQIILESLPISSSGHLKMFGFSLPDSIDRLTSGVTIIVLLIYFYKDIIYWLKESVIHPRKILSFLMLLYMATSVTVFLYSCIQLIIPVFPIWIGFFITACSLFSLVWRIDQRRNIITYRSFFILGFVQGIASLPGVSRLATTYVAATWLGFEPAIAFRLSCALQVPLFLAGFLEGLYSVWHEKVFWAFNIHQILMILGAMIIAYSLLWFIERLMKSYRLWYFGWYMLFVALIAYMQKL